MYPYIVIGHETVPTYLLISGMGIVISYAVFCYLVRNINGKMTYMKVLILSLIGMLIGARILGIISNLIYLYNLNESIIINDVLHKSGIVYYGGLFGFLFTFKVLCYVKKHDFKEVRNIIAIIIPLFHFFGRIACYFSGCCYGKESNSILSVSYRTGLDGIWEERIPIQLYEAIYELFLFSVFMFIFAIYKKNREIYKHNMISYYLVAYSVWRMFAECFRGDDIRGMIGILSVSQIISLMIIIYQIKYLLVKKEKKDV